MNETKKTKVNIVKAPTNGVVLREPAEVKIEIQSVIRNRETQP